MSSGEAERAAPSVPTAANDVSQILEGMRQMREELRSVRQGQEETALRIERNARKDTYSFKRRGNELQYRFNAEVADKVAAAAATSIEKVETTSIRSKELLDRAARDLRKGNALLAHRQKIIKLADRSESGWAAVDEYEGDDLAEDSDDEKRMEKAENRAERKLAKKRKIKEARMKDDVGAKSAIPPGALRPFPARFPAGTCFECGDPGHWRKECPMVAQGSAYPFSNSEHWWMVEKVLMCCMCHLHLMKPWVKMGVMRCQNVCLAGAGRCKKVRCMEVL